VTVEPGTPVELRVEFPPLPEQSDLWRLTARLASGGAGIDEIATGVVRENPAIRSLAPPLRFRDNYFTLGGRPVFLYGSDSYSETYTAASENPLTWSHELETARDFGVQLYENLQYNHPDSSSLTPAGSPVFPSPPSPSSPMIRGSTCSVSRPHAVRFSSSRTTAHRAGRPT